MMMQRKCSNLLKEGSCFRLSQFARDESVFREDIVIGNNATMVELNGLIRGVFNLTPATPLLITFQLPQWMLEPDGETSPPHNIVANADIDMLMSIHEWNTEPQLCLIFGAEDVASGQALKETFTEADLVSLYRFSFEIERARNRLDLNVGAADITGDHVVPNHIHPNRSEPRLGPVNQPE
ncbi:hypothetical protein F2Q69_00000633 [Brassica cretica]|uniref:Uncharacterized protein n=1 Tax=Brassica cretica TaxID=69181 RepID=A0A8S9PF46_BRACR|nr:hypothetical protein F2Q69_00000633 [Brassica cretica]